jgi:uncharacterized paraquat-inducible protein A
MMEVFIMGILVSLVKLVGMAQIVPGIALWSFVLLIPVLAAATSSLDAEWVWRRVGLARRVRLPRRLESKTSRAVTIAASSLRSKALHITLRHTARAVAQPFTGASPTASTEPGRS